MEILATLRLALRALARNKLRSALTMLGIIIGVGAVIAMVAIGEGAQYSVEQQFAAMGTNLLMLVPGSTNSGGARGGFGSQPTLTWEDLRAIQSQVPTIQYAAPVLSSRGQVLSEDANWSTQIQGTSPDYFDARNWPIQLGSRFSQSDVESGAKVAVVGSTVASKLFGEGSNPVGQTIRIKNVPFQIIGETASKGQSSFGQDYDDVVFVPYTTFETKIQGGLAQYINGMVMLSAISPQATATAEKQVSELLRDRHHIEDSSGNSDDFFVRNLAEIASARAESSRVLSLLLASIAAVSLLVGGIGIMNIMLVSVTERTREIGVRMAIGARPRDVLLQFLIEALTLSFAGGVIGVGLGVLAAQRLAASFHWPLLLNPQVMLIALGFSALVGVGFGLYPARKASRLDPIDALRFE
jgi:putative ABC transport system permease protein